MINLNGANYVGREVLTANRIYYVRTDGNDTNNGLTNSSAGAFLTIQKAIDVVANLDIGSYDATIQIADGTYTSTNVINIKRAVGIGKLIISGNSGNASSVIITGDNNAAVFKIENQTDIEFRNITIQATTSVSVSRTLIDSTNAQYHLNNVRFGLVPSSIFGSQINAVNSVITSQGHTIFANAASHMFLVGASVLNMWEVTATITLSNSPVFSFFLVIDNAFARINKDFVTFSGNATGTRYLIRVNGAINTNGGVSTYLPGNVDGILQSGGQYV